MRDRKRALTAEELDAVRRYAAEHGRTWKSKLNGEWMRASATQILHALRNTHGPSWLVSFRLREVAEVRS